MKSLWNILIKICSNHSPPNFQRSIWLAEFGSHACPLSRHWNTMGNTTNRIPLIEKWHCLSLLVCLFFSLLNYILPESLLCLFSNGAATELLPCWNEYLILLYFYEFINWNKWSSKNKQVMLKGFVISVLLSVCFVIPEVCLCWYQG